MYKFDPRGEPVAGTFRAIAKDQLDEALADLEAGKAEARTQVHEGRRRCKKLRGLLRLVRPVFAGYDEENRALRAASAMLSHLRDAEVVRHTLESLAKIEGNEDLTSMVSRLDQDGSSEHDPVLSQFRERLAEIRTRAADWDLKASGGEALLPGFKRTYRQARERFAAARERGGPQRLHEWRKANKYHGFHLDLLKRIAPDVLAGSLDTTDRLSTLLGEHHDLAVLLDMSGRNPDRFGTKVELERLGAAIAKRLEEIESAAFELGRQVCAETPRAIERRFAAYWNSAS